MIKTINISKRLLVIVGIILLLIMGYYSYYKNSNIYKEFEISSETEELLPYEEDDKMETKEEDIETKIEERIMVYITGEVNNWGVIELEKGSRIIDAVNKAGGFTDLADVGKVNLAYELTDGVQIYIPSKNEENENSTTTKEYITSDSGDNVVVEESEMKQTTNSIININKATQTELETLPGIGPSIALKIISYREENGNFSSIEDIKNVSGIGENKFNNIKELICI